MIQLLKQIYPYIKPNKLLAIWASLAALPIAAIKAYEAYFIKNVIDGIFDPNATELYAWSLGAIVVGLAVISYPLRYLHFYGMRMVVDRAICLIRDEIYKKFQGVPASFYTHAKQGELLSIMINDTLIFANSFMNAMDLVREPLTALLLMGVAFYHDWKLSLIIFGASPFFILIFNVTGKRIRRYTAKAQIDTANMTHHAAEGLSGQKIIKAFNLQHFMIDRFSRAQDDYLAHKFKSNSAEEHSHPLVEIIGAMAFALVIALAFYRAQSGLTAGEFISFVGVIALFMDPVRKFSKANTKLNQARAAAQRIFRLLNSEEEVNEGKREITDFSREIEFKNVTFSYGDAHNVVEDFSLTIKKGQRVALVGLSGSGKSTLLSLLLRLYDIEQGEILIDGINIKDYSLKSLRNVSALVSQDIFLFNDSVYQNLTTGCPFQSQEIEKALEVSYAQEFIKKIPDGVETMIGDRGVKLSGGQAQRLTIARAFLRNSPILLFDEATSALDNESEKIVQKALDSVSGDKTVIAVAHRLSTIQEYDTIVVMKEGKKVEQGTHGELMNLRGEYHKLHELSLLGDK